MKKGNLYNIPEKLPSSEQEEIFEKIFNKNNVLVERIISNGQKSPKEGWYNQNKDEVVFLLQGTATIEFLYDDNVVLQKGDYIIIEKHKKHKVIKTSSEPPCIWITVHI